MLLLSEMTQSLNISDETTCTKDCKYGQNDWFLLFWGIFDSLVG